MLQNFIWSGFSDARIATQLFVVLLVVSSYIWIIVLDFKYQEMEVWKVLLCSVLNLVLPVIPVFIWGSPCMQKAVFFMIPIWLVIFLINLKFNKETIIGQADIDVLAVQIAISSVIVAWSIRNMQPDVALLHALMYLQDFITALFVGLVALVVIWSVVLLSKKLKEKDKSFRTVIEENRSVPTIIAFIPLIVLNLYLIMGT